MNEKVLHTLEYDKIVAMLEQEATSEPGAFLCRGLVPTDDISAIRLSQKETGDALGRILRKGNLSFSGVTSPGETVKRLEIGSPVSAAALLRLCDLLEVASRARSYGKKENPDEPDDSLSGLFAALEPVPGLTREIRRCILSEDEIADDASSELSRIRRTIAKTEGKVHSTLTSMVNGRYHTYLQDPVITMRDNRYCLPVKAEYRSYVQGIIHDQSSSGATLFIEPIAVVNIGNELKALAAEEEEEIARILARLSVEAAGYIPELLQDYETLKFLDFIFAKGRLALIMNASVPVYNEDGYIRIREGRHPLLDRDSVVPINIELGKDFYQLIITGPNTGGKTVSLKTVGLLCLMGQAGLHIPAGDRSELAVFTEVYADIGDEQSIEQSLSTFSSHMTNIVRFLGRVDENSLVLFDELCSGTDPTEGAALAIAILTRLNEHRIRTMATTHYSELKVFALSTPGVCNASCEFDVETLRPTYRILMGVPGKSNAFAISKRLGLDDAIIEEAKNRMDEQDESLEDLLAELENSRVVIEREKDEIRQTRLELKRLKEEEQSAQQKLAKQKAAILREAEEEAEQILSEAKDFADDTIRAVRKLGGAGVDEKELERRRAAIRNRLKEKRSRISDNFTPQTTGGHKPSDFHIGDRVHVISVKVDGKVNTLPDASGQVEVQMGILRSRLPHTDLVILPEENSGTPKYKKAGTGTAGFSKSLTTGTEINLLGKTVDEAVVELDKYLDDAFLAHLESVRIVHGKGTGALRKGVHQYLKKNRHVKDFRLGGLGEGDTGVTIATLKIK